MQLHGNNNGYHVNQDILIIDVYSIYHIIILAHGTLAQQCNSNWPSLYSRSTSLSQYIRAPTYIFEDQYRKHALKYHPPCIVMVISMFMRLCYNVGITIDHQVISSRNSIVTTFCMLLEAIFVALAGFLTRIRSGTQRGHHSRRLRSSDPILPLCVGVM